MSFHSGSSISFGTFGQDRGMFILKMLFFVHFTVGGIYFPKTVVATGYLLFAQVPHRTFDKLAEEGTIRDIDTADEYIRRYDGQPRTPSEPKEVVIGGDLDEDQYGLGLDNWKGDDDKIRMLQVPVGGSELLREYPFTKVGEADITVAGRHEERKIIFYN